MKTTNGYTDEEVETIKKMYKTHFDYEIAEVLGRTRKSVNWKINSLELPDRVHSSTLRKLRKWESLENQYGIPIKDLLYELHWKLNLPIRNGMDKALGVSQKAITEWMKELGVQHRSISEDNLRRYSTMLEDEIKAQTLAANDAVRQNGQPKNIGRVSWSAGLTKDNHPSLKIISEKKIGKNNPMWNITGENHPQWKGGKRYWKLKEWLEIREQAKTRDGFTCQECGITEEECLKKLGQPLQVHHTVPYRISKKHILKELITLCGKCHAVADNKLRGEKCEPKKSPQLENENQRQSTIYQY